MTLVEIEKSDVILPAMAYRKSVWYFLAYETGQNDFSSWMDEGKLGRDIVSVGGIIINAENYVNAIGTEDPMTLQPKRFCQMGNKVYVRTENSNPLHMYYNPKCRVYSSLVISGSRLNKFRFVGGITTGGISALIDVEAIISLI